VFSFFRKGGINNTTPTEHGSIEKYIEIVRNNPERELVQEIRELRLAGNEQYKILKQSASYCTPSCFIKERDLSDTNFDQNFIEFSGFIYFDIDLKFENQLNDAKAYKQYFINTYGKYVTTVALSISGGGISVLVKVSNDIKSKMNTKRPGIY